MSKRQKLCDHSRTNLCPQLCSIKPLTRFLGLGALSLGRRRHKRSASPRGAAANV